MKRELHLIKYKVYSGWRASGCCPGHDQFPCTSYKNRRSKKARARDKAREHRYARRVVKNAVLRSLKREED